MTKQVSTDDEVVLDPVLDRPRSEWGKCPSCGQAVVSIHDAPAEHLMELFPRRSWRKRQMIELLIEHAHDWVRQCDLQSLWGKDWDELSDPEGTLQVLMHSIRERVKDKGWYIHTLPSNWNLNSTGETLYRLTTRAP